MKGLVVLNQETNKPCTTTVCVGEKLFKVINKMGEGVYLSPSSCDSLIADYKLLFPSAKVDATPIFQASSIAGLFFALVLCLDECISSDTENRYLISFKHSVFILINLFSSIKNTRALRRALSGVMVLDQPCLIAFAVFSFIIYLSGRVLSKKVNPKQLIYKMKSATNYKKYNVSDCLMLSLVIVYLLLESIYHWTIYSRFIPNKPGYNLINLLTFIFCANGLFLLMMGELLSACFMSQTNNQLQLIQVGKERYLFTASSCLSDMHRMIRNSFVNQVAIGFYMMSCIHPVKLDSFRDVIDFVTKQEFHSIPIIYPMIIMAIISGVCDTVFKAIYKYKSQNKAYDEMHQHNSDIESGIEVTNENIPQTSTKKCSFWCCVRSRATLSRASPNAEPLLDLLGVRLKS